MRHAVAEFDDARLGDVEHLLAWIANAPETNARTLRATTDAGAASRCARSDRSPGLADRQSGGSTPGPRKPGMLATKIDQ